MNHVYITLGQLSERLGYKPETINRCMIDEVLIEGTHYVRPLGGRKRLFLWDVIEQDMISGFSKKTSSVIPMANGGVCHG